MEGMEKSRIEIPEVQVSDTRDGDSSTSAGAKIKTHQ